MGEKQRRERKSGKKNRKEEDKWKKRRIKKQRTGVGRGGICEKNEVHNMFWHTTC